MISRPSVSRSLRSRRAKAFAGAAAGIAILSGPIQAATYTWDKGANTFLWGTADNWDPNAIPVAGDTINLTNTTAGIFGNIDLENVERSVSIINFNANTSDRYRFVTADKALGFLSGLTQINQTQDDPNEIQVRVRAGDGTGVLSTNVTSNTLGLQEQITSGGLIKTGGATLRLGTSGTSFVNAINGNIQLNGGSLTASGGLADGSNNILGGTGNITLGASGVNLRLDFSSLAAAGPAGTYDFVRDIVANNNNFTLTVDRAAGSADSGISKAGILTMGNATMTLNGANGFTAQLDGLKINAGATTGLNTNVNLRLDSLEGDAATTLVKNNGSTLTLSAANNANFLGTIRYNGGTITLEGSAGNSPTLNSAGLVFTTSATLNLRSAESVDYGLPISFGPGVASATISVDRLGGAATNQVLSFGELNIGGTGLANGAVRNLNINAGNGYTFVADGVRIGAGEVGTLTTNTNGTITNLVTAADALFLKRGGSALTINGDNSATSSGDIEVRAGALTGTSVGAFGTGLVTVGDTTPTSAGGIGPAASRVGYSAVGASANSTGVDVLAIAGGVIDLNVVPTATDVFEVRADGRIQGDAAQLAGLTVGTNLTLANDAIIVHDAPSSASPVVGLPNTANIFYGISNTANAVPTIGAGTPWKGLSSDNTGRTIQGLDAANPALININGGDNNTSTIEATLQGMFNANLTFNTDYAFDSTAVGGEKVTLGIRGVLGTGFSNIPGGLVILNGTAAASGLAANVDKIVVTSGGLSLTNANALGGVPVEVQNNGLLDIGNTAGNVIDGDVTFKSGGMFVFNDNQILAGTGVLTFEGGSKLALTDAAPATFFDTATQTMNFVGTNHTVRFAASNINQLDAKIPNAGVTYVVSGGAAAATIPETNISASLNTQTAGLTLENGILTNDASNNPHRAIAGPINLNNTNLTVAATRNTSFVVTSEVKTTGDIQVGSLTPIDGRDKSTNVANLNGFGMPDPFNNVAQVVFTGAFEANDVTALNTHLAFSNGATTLTGDLSITGGVLYLDGGGPISTGRGDLTTKLATDTFANSITLGNFTRSEMSFVLGDTAGAVLEVNTPFIIEGDVNPQDNRRLWVNRASGGNTRVNLNDVSLKAGSTFSIEESGTDVRVGFKLLGDATIFRGNHSDLDFLSLTRDPSLPAGTSVATLGRINQTGIQGYNNTVSRVYGEFGAGVEVNIVRGQLLFQPGSSINGVVRTQTAAAGGDSFVVSTGFGVDTNLTDTTIGGTGRVELGRSIAANGPEDFEVRGTETTTAAGPAPLHTHTGEIRIINDGTAAVDGVVRSNRANDSNNLARVRVENVVLNDGATVQFTTSNSVLLPVGKVTLSGSGTIETVAGGVTLETIDAGTNTINFTGGTAPTVAGALTAGVVNSGNVNFSNTVTGSTRVNVVGGTSTFSGAVSAPTVSLESGNGNFNGSVTATTAVNVGGGTENFAASYANFAGSVTAPVVNVNGGTSRFAGTVTAPSVVLEKGGAGTFVGGVTGSVSVDSSTATFNPGVGVEQTIGGPVSLDYGTMRVASGIVDLGTNGITSTSAEAAVIAGLREGVVAGAFNLDAANTSNSVRLGPVMAHNTSGWSDNQTYVYTGEFFVPETNGVGSGTGTFAFAENFDDSVQVEIDGVEVLRNETWNDATGTGARTLPTGWHAIEMRFGQGGGGAGPSNNDGWNLGKGFGIDLITPVDGSTGSPGNANFVPPVDNGSMNLFRTTAKSEVSVAAGAELKAASMSQVGKLAFSGAQGKVELTGAAESSAGEIVITAGASGELALTNPASITTVSNLNLDGDLLKSGEGTLIITAEGSGTGNVTVEDGTLGGGGSIAGNLVALDGTIAPGVGTGILDINGFDLKAPAVLQIELNGATAGTGYDQLLLSGTNVTGVTLEGSLQATLGFIPNIGDVFLIILNGGTSSLTGTFADTVDMGTVLVSGVPFTIDYGYNGNGDGQLNDVALIAQVPEPTSMLALLSGFGMLAGLQRFRRTSRQS